jgi:PhnB protein
MARVSTYLNFPGTTEAAFNFYKKAFGGEFQGVYQRFGDLPPAPGQPEMSEAIKRMVLHVELPILGGHVLMGTDAPAELGFQLTHGNNVSINLEPDSREEADKLFLALGEGGVIEQEMQDMFWGDYYGHLIDPFGIRWMINVRTK